MPPVTVRVVARGPVRSKGPEAINRQLDSFKAAIERSGAEVDEAFVPVLAPGWLDHFIFNEYYSKFGAIFSRPPSNLSGYTATPTTALSFEPYAEVQRLKRGPTGQLCQIRACRSAVWCRWSRTANGQAAFW
jgi:hypothetical protein